MGKNLIARGQVSIVTQTDPYTINLSTKEYIYPADSSGKILTTISLTCTVKVTSGDASVTNFTIGTVAKPTGFSTVTVNNTNKTVVIGVAANTTTLADSGMISIPIIIEGETYTETFVWSKSKQGGAGENAYTVNLSRQSYVISTDKDGKIHTAVSMSTVVSAYKGGTSITPIIGSLPSVVGCSLSKSGTTITITFSIGTSLAENGVIDIPLTIDGKSFVTSFSYAKARTGADGITGAAGVDANMLDWVADWNTNKTVLGNDSLITPKIFAGVKNSNGTLTGTAIGNFSLSTLNTSGAVTTETINGIYGFKGGYKTFFVDNNGNAQLGRDKQYIKYDAATGKVKFGSEVTLNWTSYIDEHTKLTYISSSGVYTGTLTASQVNAINIDATSIKTGILNADRIAAGSIKAEKLDATSIKSDIINTSYINGLECTFSKGIIGGWSIDKECIYSNSGARYIILKTTTGDSPLGSNRGHRGLTIYNDDGAVDAGQVKIVQMGALANKNTTQSYSSETNYGFRIALKGGTDIFRADKDGAFIAGWQFNETEITKNSVKLSADGSFLNGNYWKLNSNGSGQIANGNIAWDSQGNVTFSERVSFYWENSSELARSIAMGRMLYRYPEFVNDGSLHFNSLEVFPGCRDHTELALMSDRYTPNMWGFVCRYTASEYTLASIKSLTFFYWGLLARANAVFIARIIAKIPLNVELICQHDESFEHANAPVTWLTSNEGTGEYKEYLCQVKCNHTMTSYNRLFYFYLHGLSDNVSFPLMIDIAFATVYDITSCESSYNTISHEGYYIGRLTSDQVNAVAINASSIKTGTLSPSRITDGSITASKLATSNVQKAIVTDDAVSNLSCTFTKGKISNWTISSNNMIYSGAGNNTAGSFQSTVGAITIGSNGLRGNKWRLEADGSGAIAGGKISWDTSGVLSFNSVSIGGWTVGDNMFWINSFTHTKGVFLNTSGAINIGINGLRGNKWRFEADGSGAIAGGKIQWNSAGDLSPIVAPGLISNRVQTLTFSSTSTKFTGDLAKYSVFYVSCSSSTAGLDLPTEQEIMNLFGVSSLPMDFGIVFTLVYHYGYSSNVVIKNVRTTSGTTTSYVLTKGNSLTMLCSKYPNFHYQTVNHSI